MPGNNNTQLINPHLSTIINLRNIPPTQAITAGNITINYQTESVIVTLPMQEHLLTDSMNEALEYMTLTGEAE